MSQKFDDDFLKRRDDARKEIDQIANAGSKDGDQRNDWFDEVYERADGDASQVPWADLEAKEELVAWLESNPGRGKSALDIATGLGDNAKALTDAGYDTTAFDISKKAIDWARTRFSGAKIDFRSEDLFSLPANWTNWFDVVFECYTIQALAGEMRERAIPTIASLVAPGGSLLIYARVRLEGADASGPPWPLMPSELNQFIELGFHEVSKKEFVLERPGRVIPHVFWELQRG